MRASSNKYISFVCFYAAGIGFLCKSTISTIHAIDNAPSRIRTDHSNFKSFPLTSHVLKIDLLVFSNMAESHNMYGSRWEIEFHHRRKEKSLLDPDEKLNFITDEKRKACVPSRQPPPRDWNFGYNFCWDKIKTSIALWHIGLRFYFVHSKVSVEFGLGVFNWNSILHNFMLYFVIYFSKGEGLFTTTIQIKEKKKRKK